MSVWLMDHDFYSSGLKYVVSSRPLNSFMIGKCQFKSHSWSCKKIGQSQNSWFGGWKFSYIVAMFDHFHYTYLHTMYQNYFSTAPARKPLKPYLIFLVSRMCIVKIRELLIWSKCFIEKYSHTWYILGIS